MFHLAKEDLRLGNLKFVSKGEIDEVFGMPIPNELISNNIRNASYYNAYLEMVAKHDQKVAAEKEGKKKSAGNKQPKPKPTIEKSSKPAHAPKPKVTKEKLFKASTAKSPKPKPAKEKSTKATPLQKAGKGKVAKVHNMKSSFQLVDEPDEEQAHSEPEPEPEQEDTEGKGKAIVTKEQVAQSLLALHTPKRRSTTDQFILQRRTPATEEASTRPYVQPLDDTSANIIHDSSSPADVETCARSDKTSSGGDTEIVQITEELEDDVEKQEKVEEKMVELDQDQAGSDPGETLESRPQLEQDPLSSTENLLSMKNLEDTYAIGDQFINEKSTVDEPGKLNVEAEVVSMVTVPIYQASSSVPPLLTPLRHVTALEKKLSDLEQTNKNLDNTTRNLGSRVYTLELSSSSRSLRDLPEQKDMKEMLHQRMFKSAQRDEFLGEKDKSRKRRRDNQDPPPLPNSDLHAPSRSSKQQSGPHDEQPIEDIPIPDSANISDSEDTGSAHLPHVKPRPEWLKHIPDDERRATPELAWVILTSYIPDAVNNWANALATTYQAPAENSLLEKTGDMRTFMNWYFQKMGKTELTQADLEGQAYEVVKPFYPDVVHLQFQMEECHKMLIDQIDWANPEDLDYLCYESKGSGQALTISKMKVARYHEFGLELLIPEHMLIDDICTYYISASYGIYHCVVRIKSYSRYGYDYLKEITLRRADHQENTIAKKDFKNLYPSDFEDLNLLLLQGYLNHLPGLDIRMLSTAVKLWTRNLVIRQRVEDFQLGIESYQKQLNLTKPGWDATGFEFKHDYTIIDSPHAVVFPVTLDYRVKEYKVNRLNPGVNTRFWTDKDVERSKEFIHSIERRHKTQRIFQNLECFVGGRVRDIDYRLF
ncbi:hypothetical protein Tco_0734962 [Tanacetum coccineum]